MTRLPGAATPTARCILIVEDDADTAVSYRMLLERHGHEVYATTAAASALAVLQHADIDVVLCDLGLPGEMSALELVSAMRHDPDLGHYSGHRRHRIWTGGGPGKHRSGGFRRTPHQAGGVQRLTRYAEAGRQHAATSRASSSPSHLDACGPRSLLFCVRTEAKLPPPPRPAQEE